VVEAGAVVLAAAAPMVRLPAHQPLAIRRRRVRDVAVAVVLDPVALMTVAVRGRHFGK